jgi:hypothetical protein
VHINHLQHVKRGLRQQQNQLVVFNNTGSLIKHRKIYIYDKKNMTTPYHDLITKAYSAFNKRDIDTVLSTFHPNVHWANGWEGGYVNGHDEVRNYWTRQWKEIDPNVEPTGFKQRDDGTLEVDVHQVAKDREGNVLFDGQVKHVFSFQDGLIKRMDIEK